MLVANMVFQINDSPPFFTSDNEDNQGAMSDFQPELDELTPLMGIRGLPPVSEESEPSCIATLESAMQHMHVNPSPEQTPEVAAAQGDAV